MFVAPFIQDIISEIANPAGGTIPIISTQFVPVVRRIGNNETMVIGGLIKKNDRSSVKKVPLLADLPLIGSLFRSTSMRLVASFAAARVDMGEAIDRRSKPTQQRLSREFASGERLGARSRFLSATGILKIGWTACPSRR